VKSSEEPTAEFARGVLDSSFAGLRACDGLEMLLAQGMLSLRRWTGREPDWDAGRLALVEALGVASPPGAPA